MLHRALHAASIEAAALYGASEAREAAILRFQQSSDVVALLVNMRGTQSSGAAGLTLTEACHPAIPWDVIRFGAGLGYTNL